MSIKIDRIASMMEKEISNILKLEIKDEQIKFVTITACHVTNDLSFAKIYVTVLDDKKIDNTIKALNNAKGFIRKELTNRIDIRHVPELEFIYDDSIAYGKKIEDKIKEIHEKENNV